MKTKIFITVLFLICTLTLNTKFITGQEEQPGTFIEESGEKQDSIKKADIFDFSLEFEEEKSSNTGLIIGIAAVVLVGGGIVFFIRRKKKLQAG